MNRIRWYHFYLVLASFDVLVIAGGLWLQHRTLANFETLLSRIHVLNNRQMWLSELRQQVVELNAPGNNVFKSRDVKRERRQFEKIMTEISKLKAESLVHYADLRNFWSELERMDGIERKVFETLAAANAAAAGERAALVETATAYMADMDQHQALALRALNATSDMGLRHEVEILSDHQIMLKGIVWAEFGFGGALVLALIGMLWYVRKLQKTDEALTAERQRVERERKERLAAIGELCSTVAHGIQNPLAAIRSSAELILDMGQIDDESRKRADDVMSECSRLSQRVSRLLNFARAEGHPRQVVSIHDTIRDVFQELEPRFAERGIHVERTCAAGPLLVMGDPDEFACVFIELLSNALDHAPLGGSVRVTCRSEKDLAVIEVSDDGPGVPANAAAHIFDLFFTTRSGGTGIGLATVRRIVESCGGIIDLVNPGGRGATFRIELPVKSSLPTSKPVAAMSPRVS